MSVTPLAIPAVVWLGAMLLLLATAEGEEHPLSVSARLALVALTSLSVFATRADLAYLTAGATSLVLAVAARVHAPAGAITLALSGIATLGAGVTFATRGAGPLTLALSLIALAMRCGVLPVHPGVAILTTRAPHLQARQFATLLALVFVHLRFADHVPAAADVATTMVALGAATAVFFGLTSLARRSLHDLLQTSTLMHGGLLFAAVGAAGRGHHAAALFACFTMAVAVGGLSYAVLALESRVGRVRLAGHAGHGRAFPRLAAALAFLGAAGVGMPGTAGFIADDLLLHALWEQSVPATIAVALASALLAIATLRAIAATLFGPQVSSVAPDLLPRERRIAVAFVALLILTGLVPDLLTTSAASLFEAP